jgi:hypothetical protein
MAFAASVIIADALAIVGNSNPTNANNAQAIRFLNTILSSISTEDFSIVSNTQDSLSLVDGTTSYSYGSGGDLNSARPVKISSAFLRDSATDDTPIALITEGEYNDIFSKDSTGRPDRLFYKPDFPLGSLKLFPTPNDTYTLLINAQKRLATVTAVGDSITLPDEYIAYLIDKLVISLGRVYGYTPTQEDHLLLRQSEGNVKTLNSDNKIIRKPTPSVSALGRGLRRVTTVTWEE